MPNRILIITDAPADAKALKAVLSRSIEGPFAVKWVRRLATGLKSLRAGGFEAIIVDLSLPDGSGIAAFERLYAAAQHTPIVTLSAGTDNTLAIEAVQRGAQGYLTKGYFVSHLVPQVLRNIIQRKAIELTYYNDKERAEIALNSISDAVICTDISGNVDYLNIAAETMTGWSRAEAHGRPVGEVFRIINGDTLELAPSPVDLVLQSNEPMGLHADTVLIRRDGSETPIEDSAAPIHDWDGRLTGVVIVFHDVNAAKAMTMKMAHLAHHDFLTDLPNRVLLNDRIAQAISLAKRNGTQLAVLFLDLDNFKLINDTFGHAGGDKLLQSVAQRLHTCVRSSDTVSRAGGDEFIILLSGGIYEQDAALTADKILAELARPHLIDNRESQITTSIGISVYPADGQDAETLIRNADIAMYTAKEKGHANYQFFGWRNEYPHARTPSHGSQSTACAGQE
ncbi:MAG: diguanylate cyclase [Betaproteobacteria bacterium HGW-Betaproteobacteria-1]|jgi:diguanylate cyclase (GGDEF)-like protein/PAS domain S-box-containing protein|nr:MAG: diguanylate cyclase [Betaproteobacteria bacterium HGW-Betaproteobacteria-1]